ncbi:hypothetical protein BOTCAL_0069g00280 [Botryotinia calthae]|uniref:Uncharacterized protein n=1 Tax=Botryotinia calthae TaxID=38488 RepID=A0A4Y8DBJ3_9HELO|nr:hypothetical protein BOTCAL_0069g00280 [Botryotinia calthae]
MSGADESNPENVSAEPHPIHHPQPAVPVIRSLTLDELNAWDVTSPNSPPPAYSPPPPAYYPCDCGRYESPWMLAGLGFKLELIFEIWDRWQLLKAQNPDVYQNMQPWMLLYSFLSFAFQVTRLPFAPPGYDPRRYDYSMVLYLNGWELPSHWYITRQWDEAQRMANCADAAAMCLVRSLEVSCEHCLGQPPPIYVEHILDNCRFNELARMAMAATFVI